MQYYPTEGHIDKMYFPYYGKKAHVSIITELKMPMLEWKLALLTVMRVIAVILQQNFPTTRSGMVTLQPAGQTFRTLK